jgi:hypothetical protein
LTEISQPVVSVVAFVDSDFDEQHVRDLRELADEWASTRGDWVLEPPRFIDETDDAGIRTVGIVHRVYAAFDEDGAFLVEAIDRRLLEEVRWVVAGLQGISGRTGIDLGLELDGESVGWIERGELSEALRVGLLEAWASRFA